MTIKLTTRVDAQDGESVIDLTMDDNDSDGDVDDNDSDGDEPIASKR